MKKMISFSILACVFYIHSSKQETNQRPIDITTIDDTKIAKQKKRTRLNSKEKIDTQLPEMQPTQLISHVTQQPFLANPLTNQERTTMNLFVRKIDFSREGISLFLNQSFNNKTYSTEFLPYSMTHLVQFLDFAHSTQQSPEFMEGAFRLFTQKLKASPCVTAPALDRFLTQAHPYLEKHLAEKPFSLWQEFKHTLSEGFRTKFGAAKNDPLGFFEHLSKDMASQVSTYITIPTRVRTTVFRFLVCNADKLIWCPTDQVETWHLFKKIGDKCYNLHTKKVIPDELDANELSWTLIERYCHFLKLAGTQLTLETCSAIKKDLSENPIVWLDTKEQETLLQTKRERLTLALMETEARIHAKEHGVMTDLIHFNHKNLS